MRLAVLDNLYFYNELMGENPGSLGRRALRGVLQRVPHPAERAGGMMFGCRKEEAVSNDLSLVKKLNKDPLSPVFGRMGAVRRENFRVISGALLQNALSVLFVPKLLPHCKIQRSEKGSGRIRRIFGVRCSEKGKKGGGCSICICPRARKKPRLTHCFCRKEGFFFWNPRTFRAEFTVLSGVRSGFILLRPPEESKSNAFSTRSCRIPPIKRLFAG